MHSKFLASYDEIEVQYGNVMEEGVTFRASGGSQVQYVANVALENNMRGEEEEAGTRRKRKRKAPALEDDWDWEIHNRGCT